MPYLDDSPYTMSPELSLVLAAVNDRVNQPRLAEAIGRLKSDNWAGLGNFADERHRVGPLLWRVLRHASDSRVPTNVMATLERQAKMNAVKTLRDKAELVRLLAALNEAGVEPIVMKGWTWEEFILGKPSGLRTSVDCDLLVKKKEFEKALECLLTTGYATNGMEIVMGKARRDILLRFNKDVALVHPSGFRLELHCRPFKNQRLFPQEAWRTETREISIGGRTARMRLPTPATAFIYLALHGFFHRWERAKWLVDLPPLLRKLNLADWYDILEDCKEHGITLPIGVALRLAHDLLGVPIEGSAVPLQGTGAARKWADICRRELMQDRNPSEDATISPRWVNRAAYFRCSSRITVIISGICSLGVDQSDLMIISLPKGLRWAYYVIGLGRRALFKALNLWSHVKG